MTEEPARKPAMPWRGRARVPDPKGRFVGLRFTAAAHATLTDAAAQAGLSLSAYLRTLATGSPGPRAGRRPSVERVELARLLAEFGKLGSNVNQLARVANTNGDLPALRMLEGIRRQVMELRGATMQALGRGD